MAARRDSTNSGGALLMSPAPLWATRMKFGVAGGVGGMEAVGGRIVNDIAAIRINSEEMRASFMDGLWAVRLPARGSVRQFEIGNWKFWMEGSPERGLDGRDAGGLGGVGLSAVLTILLFACCGESERQRTGRSPCPPLSKRQKPCRSEDRRYRRAGGHDENGGVVAAREE